jgi:hypothetical protein
MAFIATVKIFFDMFYQDFRINYLSNQITKIENKLKNEYNTMTPIEVNKLYIKHNQIKHELFKLKNTK